RQHPQLAADQRAELRTKAAEGARRTGVTQRRNVCSSGRQRDRRHLDVDRQWLTVGPVDQHLALPGALLLEAATLGGRPGQANGWNVADPHLAQLVTAEPEQLAGGAVRVQVAPVLA